jgi:lysozyme family protein
VAQNAARWGRAKLTQGPAFTSVAKKLVANKSIYRELSALTGVPWFVIAVIHQREASGSFGANIANGQAWMKKTTIVPIGRGPFKSFKEAALDALINCAPYASKWKDWTPGGTLALLEQYNGLGYYTRGVPSPYIWSGTDQYKSGKYIRDHVYDPNTVDAQLGCAGLILAMIALDSSIAMGLPSTPEAHVANEHPAAPAGVTKPVVAPVAPTGIIDAVAGFFRRITQPRKT